MSLGIWARMLAMRSADEGWVERKLDPVPAPAARILSHSVSAAVGL